MSASTPTGLNDVTLDDRRWALLAYLFTPIVPLFILMLDDVRQRPFVRAHLGQALALGAVAVALLVLAPMTLCLTSFLFVLLYAGIVYWGVQAYNGQIVRIPYLSEYIEQQGWFS